MQKKIKENILNFNYKKYKKFLLIFLLMKIVVFLILAVNFLLINNNTANAAYEIPLNFIQVKTINNPKVYYLDHGLKLKKAYVNESAYLMYGNKWSDIKIINQTELENWSDVNLVKTKNQSAVYYIKDSKKTKILNPRDFVNFGFDWEKVINISPQDLDTYNAVSYEEIGLHKSEINNIETSNQELSVSADLTDNSNHILPVNTKNNLVGIFTLESKNAVAINELVFALKGVFNSEAIERVYLVNGVNIDNKYEAIRDGRRIIFIMNNNPLVISPLSENKIKIYIDMKGYENSLNHNIKFTIEKSSDIKAS